MPDTQTILTIAVLVFAGLLFIVLEVLTPTFGVLAALALGSLVAAVWFAFAGAQWLGITVLVVLAVGVPFYLAALVKYLPRSPLGRRFFLSRAPEAPADAVPEAETFKSLVGRQAVAETPLRPSGTIRIDGRRVIAAAETGMIERGTKVKVVATAANNVVVRKMDEP